MKIAHFLRFLSPLVLAGAIAGAAVLSGPVPASAENGVAIPTMSQQDPAWGPSRLGTSPGDTIGSSGCAVTAVTMMLRYYGIDTDPAMFNAWLTANGGYAFDDQLIWDAVTRYTGGQVAFAQWTGADLTLIQNELDNGRPVVAEVSLYGNQHFVLIVGDNSATGLVINDPWFGDTVKFADRYGDPASGIVSIRTFIPAGGAPEPSWLPTRLPHAHLAQ